MEVIVKGFLVGAKFYDKKDKDTKKSTGEMGVQLNLITGLKKGLDKVDFIIGAYTGEDFKDIAVLTGAKFLDELILEVDVNEFNGKKTFKINTAQNAGQKAIQEFMKVNVEK